VPNSIVFRVGEISSPHGQRLGAGLKSVDFVARSARRLLYDLNEALFVEHVLELMDPPVEEGLVMAHMVKTAFHHRRLVSVLPLVIADGVQGVEEPLHSSDFLIARGEEKITATTV
jgi:hypothetical protein